MVQVSIAIEDDGAVSGSDCSCSDSLADFLGANKVDPAKLTGAQTTLAQAIGIAEQNTNGKAIEAEVDEDTGGIHYEVTVLVGDEAREVEVDGSTGQILKAER